MDSVRSPLLKPEPRKKVKARRRRAEKKVKADVRARVVGRDGPCIFWLRTSAFGPCEGASEWNHLRKRSLTRGMAAERRHSTETSVMTCTRHHKMLDDHVIWHRYLTDRGADGSMEFWYAGDGAVWRLDRDAAL